MAIQKWYYKSNQGEEVGPLSGGEMKAIAKTGLLNPESYVRGGNSAKWIKAIFVRGLFPGHPASSSTNSVPGISNPKLQSDVFESIIHAAPDSDEVKETPPEMPNRLKIPGAVPIDPFETSLSVTSTYDSRHAATLPQLSIAVSSIAVLGLVVTTTVVVWGLGLYPFKQPVIAEPATDSRSSIQESDQNPELAKLEKEQARTSQAIRLMNQAKALLTSPLHEIGGDPTDNVKKAISLLKECESIQDIDTQESAKSLREVADLTLSEDAGMMVFEQFPQYEQVEKMTGRGVAGGAANLDRLYIKRQVLDSLNPDLAVFIGADKQIESNSFVVVGPLDLDGFGEVMNSLNLCLFHTVMSAAPRKLQVLQDSATQTEKEKSEAIDIAEAAAVLLDGTPIFKQIRAFPDEYIFKNYYFDGMFGSVIRNVVRDQITGRFLIAFRCQDEVYVNDLSRKDTFAIVTGQLHVGPAYWSNDCM